MADTSQPVAAESTLMINLLQKLENRTAVIGVVGLGYVGLPLILEFHAKGFPVMGLDIDPAKIEALSAGRTYLIHIGEERIAEMAGSGRFRGSADMAAAAECDALLLCVPTPLDDHREPDMSYVHGTARAIAPYLKRGQVIALESTTYPGTTEEEMIPILEEGSGLKAGEDFFVVYSPEREDPGNAHYGTSSIPKVVGGHTPEALRVGLALYDAVVCQTVPVSSCAAAEATKLVENIFRSVNIAMVNELKTVFHRMGIDIWEVIDAAKTKPFGFMPFYPGPGLGGHCIPIDPFYLTWKAREYEIPTKFIELAGEINSSMPDYVVHRTMEALNDDGKALNGSRILLVGLAYKPDVDDVRESPSFKLFELLEQRGARVEFHDPYVPAIPPTRRYPHLAGRPNTPIEQAGDFDAVLIATNHRIVDYKALGTSARLIIDTRNAMNGVPGTTARICKA